MVERGSMRVAAAVAVLVAVVAWALWPSDPSAALRRLPARAALAFNQGDLLAFLELFEPLWFDDSGDRRVDRDTLRAAMLVESRGFVVRTDDDGVSVSEFDPTAGTARVKFTLRLLRSRVPGVSVDEVPEWVVGVEAGVRRAPTGDWRFVVSQHVTLAGKMPGR